MSEFDPPQSLPNAWPTPIRTAVTWPACQK